MSSRAGTSRLVLSGLEGELVNEILNGKDISEVDPEMHRSLLNPLSVVRNRAIIQQDSKLVRKIDQIISSLRLSPVKTTKTLRKSAPKKTKTLRKSSAAEVTMTDEEREMYEAIVDQLEAGDELDGIDYMAVPKLRTVMKERLDFALTAKKYRTARVLKDQLEKLGQIAKKLPIFLPRPKPRREFLEQLRENYVTAMTALLRLRRQLRKELENVEMYRLNSSPVKNSAENDNRYAERMKLFDEMWDKREKEVKDMMKPRLMEARKDVNDAAEQLRRYGIEIPEVVAEEDSHSEELDEERVVERDIQLIDEEEERKQREEAERIRLEEERQREEEKRLREEEERLRIEEEKRREEERQREEEERLREEQKLREEERQREEEERLRIEEEKRREEERQKEEEEQKRREEEERLRREEQKRKEEEERLRLEEQKRTEDEAERIRLEEERRLDEARQKQEEEERMRLEEEKRLRLEEQQQREREEHERRLKEEEAERIRIEEEKRRKEEEELLKLEEQKRMEEEAEANRLRLEQEQREEAERLKLEEQKRMEEEAEANRLRLEQEQREEAERLRLEQHKRLEETAQEAPIPLGSISHRRTKELIALDEFVDDRNPPSRVITGSSYELLCLSSASDDAQYSNGGSDNEDTVGPTVPDLD